MLVAEILYGLNLASSLNEMFEDSAGVTCGLLELLLGVAGCGSRVISTGYGSGECLGSLGSRKGWVAHVADDCLKQRGKGGAWTPFTLAD